MVHILYFLGIVYAGLNQEPQEKTMELFLLAAVILLFGCIIYVSLRQRAKKGPGGGSGYTRPSGPDEGI